MSFNMQITRGKIEGPQKVCIYGPEGIGKSTLAAQFPNPVFIDTEGSTKHLDVARLPKPSSWTMLLEQVKYFKNNPHVCNTLVIDTADWAERLCKEEILAKAQKDSLSKFSHGRGYVILAEEFGRLLNLLEDLIEKDINIIITAHATMRKFEQPDEMGAYDRWELKLEKKVFPLLKEWADMVLFANYKTFAVKGQDERKNKVQGGKRVMYTTHHPCWDAKNRHNLPEEMPLDYAGIAHCIPAREKAKSYNPETRADPPPEPKNNTALKPDMPKPPAPPKLKPPEPEAVYDPEASGKLDPAMKIPKPLFDLMEAHGVAAWEIQAAVASRGYYPQDMPISDYDPDFVQGCLVGAWEQMYGLVEKMRADKYGDEEVPF